MGSRGTLKNTLHETVSMKTAKPKAGSYAMSQKIKDWALWRGQPPTKIVEEPTCIISIRRARDVGAPDTLDSFTPTVGMKKDRKRLMFIYLN
jgi:hypothetical protein